MNLVPAIGMRTRYTWKEVAGFLGLRVDQVRNYVYHGGRLRKRFEGQFPFDQSDVNQFITRFNAGQINPGCSGFASRHADAKHSQGKAVDG